MSMPEYMEGPYVRHLGNTRVTKKSRVERRCIDCGKVIPVGSKVLRQVVIVDGQLDEQFHHGDFAECQDQWQYEKEQL